MHEETEETVEYEQYMHSQEYAEVLSQNEIQNEGVSIVS